MARVRRHITRPHAALGLPTPPPPHGPVAGHDDTQTPMNSYLDSPHLIPVFDYDILHMELNTYLYLLVLALVVMFFLKRWLFVPIVRTLDARAALRESLDADVARHREEVVQLVAQYEEDFAKVREEVAQVRAESHRETQRAVNEVLQQARAEGQQQFDAAMEQLRGQLEETRAQVSTMAQSLAEQAANRILGA